MDEKSITLRALTADDIFPVLGILSKVGIKELKQCFASEDVKSAISSMNKGDNQDSNVAAIGVSVAFDMAGILMQNLPKCKNEIYQFLSQLSGMSTNEIANMPMVDFTQLIIDVITKEEFKDFFKAVSKYFK